MVGADGDVHLEPVQVGGVGGDAGGGKELGALPGGAVKTVPKKKKKRKKGGLPAGSAVHVELREGGIVGDDVHAWRARAESRYVLLQEAVGKCNLAGEELKVAVERMVEAENAEAAVNSGLVTARAVIAERDRAIVDLNSAALANKAEIAKLTDEKKKTDKRLLLLKTVSANLQQAREARDAAEKRVEELGSAHSKLKASAAALAREVEELRVVKAELIKRELEVEELKTFNEKSSEHAVVKSARAAGAGAAGVIALQILMRLLLSGPNKD